MATVTVEDGALRIALTVPERVLSLHPAAAVVIALADVRGVRVARNALAQLRGSRMPGARVPGLLAIGTWSGTDRGQEFHDFVLVECAGPGVVLDTAGSYDRIVLSCTDAEALGAKVRRCAQVRASAGRPPTG